MRLGLGRSEKGSTSSNDNVEYAQNYPGANEALAGDPNYDPNNVPCPAHTTERKLLARIDLHVIPFLVLLYWLAFLDRYVKITVYVLGMRGTNQSQSQYLQRQRLWSVGGSGSCATSIQHCSCDFLRSSKYIRPIAIRRDMLTILQYVCSSCAVGESASIAFDV
jgi:hypothetical protein